MIKLTDEKIISILNQDSSFFSAFVSNLKYVVIIFIVITIVLLLIKKSKALCFSNNFCFCFIYNFINRIF